MVESIHKPFCATYLAVDSTGKLICERILTIHDDSKTSLDYGSRMLVESLIKDQEMFKKIIQSDFTKRPSLSDMNRFFETDACVICGSFFDFNLGKYQILYLLLLKVLIIF